MNAFQHIFVNQKKSEFYGPYFQAVISCDYAPILNDCKSKIVSLKLNLYIL